MFIHILSYLGSSSAVNTSATLNMWGGVGYSNSHSGRDMLGFSSTSDSVDDLYSLYFRAPYLDTASEINSTDNI